MTTAAKKKEEKRETLNGMAEGTLIVVDKTSSEERLLEAMNIHGSIICLPKQQVKTAFKAWLKAHGKSEIDYQVVEVRTGPCQVTKVEETVIKGL